MHLQSTLELSMVLDAEKFNMLFNQTYDNIEYSDNDEYTDHSLSSKGITVTYRDSQYKKKIKLVINLEWVLDDDKPDPDKLIRKLKKRVDNYFGSRYRLNDFNLTGLILTTDIDVQNSGRVADYIKVLQRVGRVKGFSQPSESWIDEDISFCLEGNSNGIEFWIYDLEGVITEQLKKAESGRKQLKTIIDNSKGILRAEVRLTESKAIRTYTNETDTSTQIAALLEKSEDLFLDTFTQVVPFGNFHKKSQAVEIIRKEVTDVRLRRRMIRLVELIAQKKSLLLAQKALDYREIEQVMAMFGAIDLSHVTISKRHNVKKLDNLYKYM